MDPSKFPVPLTTPSPTEGFVFASDPTPSTTPPTPGPSNGAIQLPTIIATVIGLVGFILLVLASSYIFRLSFKRPSRAPPALPPPRPWSHNYIRRPSPIRHVESTIVSSTLTPAIHWSQPYDHDNRYLPPYEGPSPPPYSEATQHALNPQHLRVPPMAVVEA